MLVRLVIEDGERISIDRGAYVRWTPGHGVEMWVQINADNQRIGVSPHFAGQSRVEVDAINLLGVDEAHLVLHGWVRAEEKTDNPGLSTCALPRSRGGKA